MWIQYSLYTGFGLPILEALACGCPVVVSNADMAREIVGNAGELIPPNDHEAWVDTLYDVLNDQEKARKMCELGQKQAANFRWADTTEEIVNIYREVA